MIFELVRFKRIVELGSITRAAEAMYVTQPALTQAIHRLEKELGLKLFRHVGKKIVLTQQGEIVYEIADKMISLWEAAKNLNQDSQLLPACSIGLFDNAALQLSDYLQETLQKTKIEIIIDRSTSLLRKTQLGLLDICVCVVPRNITAYTNIALVKEYEEKLIPVSATIWDKPLSQIPFIIYTSDSVSQQYVSEAFMKQEVRPRVIAESINPLFMKGLALKNAGVALLPENMIAAEVNDRKLLVQNLPIQFSRTCGIFLNKDNKSKVTQKIIEEIVKRFD